MRDDREERKEREIRIEPGSPRSPAHARPLRTALSDSGNRSLSNGTTVGSRRRGALCPGGFSFRRQCGSIGIHGQEVIRLELRIIGQDLLLGCPAGKALQNLLNRYAVTADARLPEPDFRIDRDAFEECLMSCWHLRILRAIVYWRLPELVTRRTGVPVKSTLPDSEK